MQFPYVGVFTDSNVISFHLSQFKTINLPEQTQFFSDRMQFLASELATKIAIVHVPYPFDPAFTSIVDELSNQSTHVIVLATEVHPDIVAFIRHMDRHNISYYICGFLNFELEHARVYPYMDWFETSTYFYRYWLPEILTRLRPFENKYRAFDVLLGRKKYHRDELYKHMFENPGIGIVTYFNDVGINIGNDTSKWIWEHQGVKIDQTPNWTVDRIEYFGHSMSLSQVIPIEVYNQTAYSVIAETCFHDNFSFYTEKTSKPIIAKRLFVMFAGSGYLSNLRKLGFHTFDHVIDESYDSEPDAVLRWRQAWEQMCWLAEQPQEEIFERIRPTVEHNFTHMMTTNWAEIFREHLEQEIVRIIAD